MNSKAKVIVAVVLLVAAGALLAVQFGLVGGGKKVKAPTGGTGMNSSQSGDSGTTTDSDGPAQAGQLKKDNF